jgi:hypothetical protein
MRAVSLVTIQGVPRSGTSWLAQIFKSSPKVALRFQPLFAYAFKDRLGPHSSREDCLRFFQEVLHTNDPFILQKDPNIHVGYPEFKEATDPSHLVLKEVRYNNILRNTLEHVPEMKAIGLVRHPCAVLDSWVHAPREFKPEWNIHEEWRTGARKNQGRPEEYFGFNKWKEAALLFLELEKERPDQMKVVRYADLNEDPVRTVSDLFGHCGLDLGPSTEAFIRASQSREGGDANSVYRKARPDDAWKWRLPGAITDEIRNELEGGPLEQFL